MANSLPTNQFFTKQQAAAFLSVSTRTLDRRHAEGVGPPRIKHGSKIGYFHLSLVAWLKSYETEPVRGCPTTSQ